MFEIYAIPQRPPVKKARKSTRTQTNPLTWFIFLSLFRSTAELITWERKKSAVQLNNSSTDLIALQQCWNVNYFYYMLTCAWAWATSLPKYFCVVCIYWNFAFNAMLENRGRESKGQNSQMKWNANDLGHSIQIQYNFHWVFVLLRDFTGLLSFITLRTGKTTNTKKNNYLHMDFIVIPPISIIWIDHMQILFNCNITWHRRQIRATEYNGWNVDKEEKAKRRQKAWKEGGERSKEGETRESKICHISMQRIKW